MTVPVETMKTCVTCKESKPLDGFHRSRQLKDGRSCYCRECASERQRGYYQRWTPEKRELHRQRVLRWRYGIDVEMVQHLYELQEGLCAICATPGDRPAINEKRKSNTGVLHVDHDHESGEVRGLLCMKCNVGLGKFDESKDMLIRAAHYLIRDKEN